MPLCAHQWHVLDYLNCQQDFIGVALIAPKLKPRQDSSEICKLNDEKGLSDFRHNNIFRFAYGNQSNQFCFKRNIRILFSCREDVWDCKGSKLLNDDSEMIVFRVNLITNYQEHISFVINSI